MTEPTRSEPRTDDFEEMLAGFDRILHDRELQQTLLDAGLLVRIEPKPEAEATAPDAGLRAALEELRAACEGLLRYVKVGDGPLGNDPAANAMRRALAALKTAHDAALAHPTPAGPAVDVERRL